MSTQRKTGKPSKTRENAGDRVTIGFRLRLIGYEDGASFLNQSRTELMQIKTISDYFRHSIENCFILHVFFSPVQNNHKKVFY